MIDDFRPDSHSGSSEKQTLTGTKVEHGNSSQFRTPEAVAAQEEQAHKTTGAGGAVVSHHNHGGDKESWMGKLKHLSKKQWIIIALLAILLIGGGITAWAMTHKSKPKTVAKTVAKPKAIAKPVAVQPTSNLTGLPISDESVNDKPVTGVMIENSTDARPQSGLDKAGVVFEAIAEGGITRFLALYQDSAPDYIGPVRSVRPYYLAWGQGFDAAIAHVGGSPEALNEIPQWGVKNLDQFANGSFFQRISSRYAPHNVYTSMANLNALESKLGYGKPSYTPLARKKENPSKTPNVTSMDFAVSGYYYNSHWDYDTSSNTYKRSEGGAAHTELDSAGKPTNITPKVVVALVMQQGVEADDLHTSYTTTGSGTAYIFQDGTLATGTWHKDSNKGNFTFTDPSGGAIQLNPGQTWFTAVGSSKYVSYK